MEVMIQGRLLTEKDIQWIREMIDSNPHWHRTRLSQEICVVWNWVAANGQLKDMACRTMLLKLERRGYLRLPARRCAGRNNSCKGHHIPIEHSITSIECVLQDLTPLAIEVVQSPRSLSLFNHLLAEYHYLGFGATVGENMKYMVFDRYRRPLACLLFGSAAWKVACRDQGIGWDSHTRQARLHLITNNTRFLILPWVKVPHLASHVLGHTSRRISGDWMQKYGHPIVMLETFVERERFRGICYQAANWHWVGETLGRSRNDRYNTLRVPVKDVYLYPLAKKARERLCHEA
ncbi:MAG: Druantia anti-phage system protein DruA [Desulfuromonadaceae bacterium]